MKDVLIGGYYNHYKNKPYKVLDVAKHSEDLQDYVVYKALYSNETAKTWIRPYKMFMEEVNGHQRFELLDPQNWPIVFSYFHSHIYFNEETFDKAAEFCEEFKRLGLDLQISSLHRRLLGPHPEWMFEVDFKVQDFKKLIDFMQKKRNGLNIFIHPLSGNELLDHTDYALFLGEKVDLNLSIFSK